jgi:hypothetical protein
MPTAIKLENKDEKLIDDLKALLKIAKIRCFTNAGTEFQYWHQPIRTDVMIHNI